jgi:hypothetical protein
MLKLIAAALSIVFCSPAVFAETNLIKTAVCRHDSKEYVLLSEQATGLHPGQSYVVLQKNPATPAKLPRVTEGSFQQGDANLQFPKMWRPTEIPLASCSTPLRLFSLFSSGGEIIREFYVKSYFTSEDPKTITEDIDELVKQGRAIPLKVRILCTSDEITDDITLCNEIRILDEIIPINPGDE